MTQNDRREGIGSAGFQPAPTEEGRKMEAGKMPALPGGDKRLVIDRDGASSVRHSTPNYALQPATKEIRKAVNLLYSIAPPFKQIEKAAGPLTVKRFPPTFASLVRMIVGQQLSTKAAAAIFARLETTLDLTPESMLEAQTSALAKAGLSKSKIVTCHALATAMHNKALTLETLSTISDDRARELLTTIRGIGPWTAEVFLLFSLGRLDAWPHSDLGLQLGYQAWQQLANRPNTRDLLLIGEDFRPVRGAAAYLLWHYYRYLKAR